MRKVVFENELSNAISKEFPFAFKNERFKLTLVKFMSYFITKVLFKCIDEEVEYISRGNFKLTYTKYKRKMVGIDGKIHECYHCYPRIVLSNSVKRNRRL